MKKIIIETIGTVNIHWIVRGYKDGAIEYQYTFYDIPNAIQAARDYLER